MFPPDLFTGQKPLFTVTADNMSQYADMLNDGQKLMFKTFGAAGFHINVFPSERTACAPQYVYDNTAKNIARAKAVDGGLTIGITGAFGGVPFPILSDDPTAAGAQAMWNHLTRWQGAFQSSLTAQYVVGNNTRTLTNAEQISIRQRYYDPSLAPEDFNGVLLEEYLEYTAPPTAVGGKFLVIDTLQPKQNPNRAYEYLVGEGRVRQLPQAEYDVPAPQLGDAVNYDEAYLFQGAMDRYVWKLVGKKEMIIPYNQQTMMNTTPEDLLGLQFVNPDRVRYEIHRCWVVEASLAPGARMTDPFRRFYIDEDTWTVVAADLYDTQNNYWRYAENILIAQPDLPGTIITGSVWYNFQEAKYVFAGTFFGTPYPIGGKAVGFAPIDASKFDPQSMANSGGL